MTTAQETRTAKLIASTGAPVLRFGRMPDGRHGAWYELLDVDGADLRRMEGAPLLRDHLASTPNVIGVVTEVRRRDGKLSATVRFGESDLARQYEAEVKAGVLRQISVGYVVDSWARLDPAADKAPRFLATRWTPLEISVVAVGADPTGRFARAEGGTDDNNNMSMGVRVMTLESTAENRAEGTVLNRDGTATGVPPVPVEDRRTGDGDLAAERQRVAAIYRMADQMNLSRAVADRFVAEGATVEHARDALLTHRAETSGARQINTRGQIDHRTADPAAARGAIVNAIAHRLNPEVALTREAEPFARMSLLGIADELAGRGARSFGAEFSRDYMGRAAGFMGTSDFTYALEAGAQAALVQKFQRVNPALARAARLVRVPDFNPQMVLTVGDEVELLPMREHGEFRSASVGEGAEFFKVETFGRRLGFTRQLIVNDRLGVLQDFVDTAARSTASLLGKLLSSALTSNPTMQDGTTLFHANRGNVAASGSALDVASLSAARVALRTMRGTEGQVLNLSPRFLIVGPALETAAQQLLTAIQAGTVADVNPFPGSGIELLVDPLIADRRFYVVADPAQAAVLVRGVLDGTRNWSTVDGNPVVEVRPSGTILGLDVNIYADLAAAVVAPQGVYMNAGPA